MKKCKGCKRKFPRWMILTLTDKVRISGMNQYHNQLFRRCPFCFHAVWCKNEKLVSTARFPRGTPAAIMYDLAVRFTKGEKVVCPPPPPSPKTGGERSRIILPSTRIVAR